MDWKFRTKIVPAILAASVWISPTISASSLDHAVDLARAGNTGAALEILSDLLETSPTDLRVNADYIVVSAWAGRDVDAWERRQTLLRDDAPAYALRTLGDIGRRLGQLEEAVSWFQRAVKLDSGNPELTANLALTLADLKRFDEAEFYLQDALRSDPQNPELWYALGYSQSGRGYAMEAVTALRQALIHEADHRGAFDLLINNLLSAGAIESGSISRRTLDQQDYVHDILTKTVRDHAGWRVRWGAVPVADPRERYDATDRAITFISNELKSENIEREPLLKRFLQFDLVVALRDRSRMQDVIDLYESLVNDDVVVPFYARQAAADAYLYLRHPKTAERLYRSVIHERPTEQPDPFVGLFYSLVEQERVNEANDVIRDYANSVPETISGDAKEPSGNWDRATAELHAGLGQAFAERLTVAEKSIAKLVTLAPENADFRAEYSAIQSFRGRPNSALEESEIGLTANPTHLDLHIHRANALLDLQRFAESRHIVHQLIREYPENLKVQRLEKRLAAHDGPEVEIYVNAADSDSTNVNGQRSLNVEARVFSKPLSEKYRAYAGIRHRSSEFTDADLDSNDISLGVEYRHKSVSARTAVTTIDNDSVDSPGWLANVAVRPSDQLTLETGVELNSSTAPLQSMQIGHLSDRFNASVSWHPNESRRVNARLDLESHDDENRRRQLSLSWRERVLSGPRLRLTAGIEASHSTNSVPDQVYYSPETERIAAAGIEARWRTMRRYEKEFAQVLSVFAGQVSEEKFGSDDYLRVRYEHIWSWSPVLELVYGIQYLKRPYDGTAETETSGYGYLNWTPKQ